MNNCQIIHVDSGEYNPILLTDISTINATKDDNKHSEDIENIIVHLSLSTKELI